MWIDFESKLPYAVKIYVGGINAISGEPAIETAESRARRRKLLANNGSMQDYVVLPKQPWLDGIAKYPGQVRQFVAMPLGQGYTVEAQLSNAEITGGIQIEITPLLQKTLNLTIVDEHRAPYQLRVLNTHTMSDVAQRLDLRPRDYVLVDEAIVPQDKLLGDTAVKEGSIVKVIRFATTSPGFTSRLRDMHILVYETGEPPYQTDIQVHEDDTINDLKFLLHPHSAYVARRTKLYLMGGQEDEAGQPLSYPLDGHMKVLDAVKASPAQGCLCQEFPSPGTDDFGLTVTWLTGKITPIDCSAINTIANLKEMIEKVEGIPANLQLLIFDGKHLDNERMLKEYGISDGAKLHVIINLRGDYAGPPLRISRQGLEMGTAAGGLIKQSIVADDGRWEFDGTRTKVFNVQVLNSRHYHQVTGSMPPTTPIDAETYAAYGYPYYSMYEEKSDVPGSFDGVKTVKQLDKEEDDGPIMSTSCLWASRRKSFAGRTRGRDVSSIPAAPFRNFVVRGSWSL